MIVVSYVTSIAYFSQHHILSCILDKCTFITHVTMLLLCVKTKTLAAQLAPAANKQCKIVGAGAEALLYFSTFWSFTPHSITNLTHQFICIFFHMSKSCLPYTLVQSFSVLFYRIWISRSQVIYIILPFFFTLSFAIFFYLLFCLS